jgi:hypothetical protein
VRLGHVTRSDIAGASSTVNSPASTASQIANLLPIFLLLLLNHAFKPRNSLFERLRGQRNNETPTSAHIELSVCDRLDRSGCARILEHLAGMPRGEAELEAGRITATLARNRRHAWASLRKVLADYPALLGRVPDRDGVVDFLPHGVATVAVLKDKSVVKQGMFVDGREG